MKITNKIYSWDGVSFENFLKLQDCKDDTECMAVLLNIKPETLRAAKISNMAEFLKSFEWMKKPMPIILPKSINGFMIPKDLNFETIGQYEDAKELDKKLKVKEGENLTAEQLSVYTDMVAVYAMPNYNEAKPEERKEFAKQFLKSPCTEVMAIGNFTQVRLIELSLPGYQTSLRLPILMRRFKLVLKSWRARLGFWVRYFLWRRKLHTNGMNL